MIGRKNVLKVKEKVMGEGNQKLKERVQIYLVRSKETGRKLMALMGLIREWQMRVLGRPIDIVFITSCVIGMSL